MDFDTQTAAQLLKVPTRRLALTMASEYWRDEGLGSGKRKRWSIADIVLAGTRLKLLDAGFSKALIDRMVG